MDRGIFKFGDTRNFYQNKGYNSNINLRETGYWILCKFKFYKFNL